MTDTDFRLWLQKYGGWILIVAFSALPVIRWLTISGNLSRSATLYGVLSLIGKLAGLVGLVLYAVNLLLAARTRWMENFFGGLNRVYIAHHLTGGIALIILLFHPLLLAVRLIDLKVTATFHDAALYLLPHAIPQDASFAAFKQAVAVNAGIIAFSGMVSLLVLTFFVKLPYRLWLFTHKFLGVAFMFAGLHVILISSDVARDNALKFYMLMWVVIGLVSFGYRTLMNNIFVRRAPYRVTEVSQHEGNVVNISMEAVEKPLDYKPGQFIFIRFLWSTPQGVIKEAHPFSIASSPKEDKLRILVKSLGDFTTSLKSMKVGTIAEIEGAYGKFTYTNFGSLPQVWIAGGIGITPFLSMARSYEASSPPVDLIYSVVHRTELLDQVALADKLPSLFPQFRYMPYVADETDGFLTADKIDAMVGGLTKREIFICGPPPMMKSLRAQLRKKGVPNSKIHSEEFSMS